MTRRYVQTTSLTGYGPCRIYVRLNKEKNTYYVSICKVHQGNRARPIFKSQYEFGGRLQPMVRDSDYAPESLRVMHNVCHEAVLDLFLGK